MGFGGGLNLYAYAAGNPVFFTDPLGLWQITVAGGVGYAGRLTFGSNSGRTNLGFAFGYGVGLMAEVIFDDDPVSFTSHGFAANIGLEASGVAKLGGE